MAAPIIVEENQSSRTNGVLVAQAGAGWTAVTSDAIASPATTGSAVGNWVFTNSSGDAIAINEAASQTYTSALLHGVAAAASRVPTVVVDGIVVGTWDQFVYGTGSGGTYRTCYPPIALAPVANAHTIMVVSAGLQANGQRMPNLMPNGGFEMDAANWSASGAGATIARTTSQFEAGAASLQVGTAGGGGGTGTGALSAAVPCVAWGTYAVKVGGMVPNGRTVQVAAREYTNNSGTYNSVQHTATITGNGAWQDVTLSFTAAVGTNYMQLLITQSDAVVGALTFYIDAVQYEPGGTNTAYVDTPAAGVTGVGAILDKTEFYTAAAYTAGKIVGGGHSIMKGFLYTDLVPAEHDLSAPQTFIGQFAALLGPSYSASNFGTNGECLAQGATLANVGLANGGADGSNPPGWYRLIDQHTNWADQLAEIYVLFWGINDVRQRGNNDPGTPANNNYGQRWFIQRIKEAIWKADCACPTSIKLVMGMSNVTHLTTTGGFTATGLPNFQHGSESLMLAWNSALANACATIAASNVYYVDTYMPTRALGEGVFFQNASSPLADATTDGVHLNVMGHTALAGLLANVVRMIRVPVSGRIGPLV